MRIPTLVLAALMMAVSATGVASAADPDPTVFDAPPFPLTPELKPTTAPAPATMRILTVEERVGVARKDDLVRIPLFFHPNECEDPNAIAIYAAEDKAQASPIPFQADDIRRGAGNQVSAMHAYFYTDMQPWQRKQFVVVKGRNPGAKLQAVAIKTDGDRVVFSGEQLKVGFLTKGVRTGAICALESSAGRLNLTEGWMGPNYRLKREDGACKQLRLTEVGYKNPENMEIREFKFATGPLFAKVRVKIGPKGIPDSAEATYLIPAKGSGLVITQRSFAEEKDTADVVGSTWPVMLWGKATFGEKNAAAVSTKIPTGLRKLTRMVHNQNVEAAVSDAAGFSVVNVPHVSSNGGGVYYQATEPEPETQPSKKGPPPAKDTLQFMGPGSLSRGGASNSGTIRAFWFQNRLVFAKTTDKEVLWDIVRANQQSLVAIVDEPGVTVDDFAATVGEVAKNFYKIKYWGRAWQQTAAIDFLIGKTDAVTKALERVSKDPKPSTDPNKPTKDDAKVEAWVPGFVKDQLEKLPPLEGRPKGGDTVAGNLQPYNIGYCMTSIVPFAKYVGPSERVDRMCYAIGKGSMLTNGKVYNNTGMPYITAFSNAFNMQVGSLYFGIYGGKKNNDPWMTMFYRDVTKNPGVIAIYGHGERCYSSDVRNAEASDVLYQGVSDLWLRSIELVCDEDLWLHPTVHSRYVDCVDVTADMQHRSLNPEKRRSWNRANFFRAQSHDHRWEAWDALPYLMIQANAADEVPPGITEALYYATSNVNVVENWSTLLNYFHPVINVKTARHYYNPPKAPALPQGTKVATAASGGATVSWQAVAGDVAGYRVYRSDQMGRMMTLLNSPYVAERHKLITSTTFVDPQGGTDKFYFVTAVDSKGIESRWFPEEPLPVPGKDAGKAPPAPGAKQAAK